MKVKVIIHYKTAYLLLVKKFKFTIAFKTSDDYNKHHTRIEEFSYCKRAQITPIAEKAF